MKKSPKQIAAIIALVAIAVLLVAFVISAFTAGPGEAGNRFMSLLLCMIAVPILAWLMIFCIGRFQNRHTIAEFSPEDDKQDE